MGKPSNGGLPMKSLLKLGLFSLLALLTLASLGAYQRDMTRLRATLADGSTLIDTRHGLMEVATMVFTRFVRWPF